jgi:predicted metal-dependent phosphoesterase TrpH
VRCLFHIHTHFSFDSLLSPREIVSTARQRRADVLIVTDHNTIRGSKEVLRLAGGNPRHVVVSGEYNTEKGDLIGLFLKDEIHTRQSDQVIREVKAQGGLVVLPHPFRGHKLDSELLKGVDLVETYNSRCSASQNRSAEKLARKLGKPALGGCDAHFAAELVAATNKFSAPFPETDEELRKVLLTAPRSMQVASVSKKYQRYSRIVRALKTCNLTLLLSEVKRLIFAPREDAS